MSEKNPLLEQLDNLPKIRQFDAFPKTQALYHQRSSRGGLWTVLVSVVIFFLFCSEVSNYLYKEHAYDFFVDSEVGEDMQINVDMTVAMQCHYLTIDVRDAVGDRLHISEQEFKKDGTSFEIGHAGRLDSLPMKDLLKSSASKAISNAQGLFFHNPAKQKLKEYGTKRFRKTTHLVPDGPACRIYGSMLVKKVTGNLHFTTLGHGYWSFEHTDHKLMNLSHVVHEFSFGPYFPNLAQPLESSVETTNEHFAVFQYFVSVVPTIYIDRRGRSLRTNQYSVTDYARVVEHGMGVPGIFIKYDIEPMTMIVRERASSLVEFLVRLAGILGGVWVCSGFAYRVTNRAAGVVKKISEGEQLDPYRYAASYGSSSAMRMNGNQSRIPEMIRSASGKVVNAANNLTGGKHRKTESVQQKIWSEEGRAW